MNRGGMDERWIGSTTETANDNRGWDDEGFSYCVHNGEKFLLRDAVAELKSEIIGAHI